MKNFLAKSSIPLLCAALMFSGCGMDQEGRGADNNGNRTQTYNAGKQGTNRNMGNGFLTNNQNNRGKRAQNNAGNNNRLTTLRGDQPGSLAGAGIMGGTNGTGNRTYTGANMFGTTGQNGQNQNQNRQNQNQNTTQGISSSLESQMQRRGMNNIRVLVIGDYVILGQQQNAGNQAGAQGTGGGRTFGMNNDNNAGGGIFGGNNNGDNGQGMFGTNDNGNNRGLGGWLGDLFTNDNDDTDLNMANRGNNAGGMAGRGMVGDTGIIGGGSAYGTNGRGMTNGAGYGMAGTYNNNNNGTYGTAGTNGMGTNNGRMTTLNDARSLIYQSFGRNVRILTVSDEKALAAMDRVKNNLETDTLAQDIQLILSNGADKNQAGNNNQANKGTMNR